MLLRENSRQFNSFVTFSDDEGQNWSTPVELPASLTVAIGILVVTRQMGV